MTKWRVNWIATTLFSHLRILHSTAEQVSVTGLYQMCLTSNNYLNNSLTLNTCATANVFWFWLSKLGLKAPPFLLGRLHPGVPNTHFMLISALWLRTAYNRHCTVNTFTHSHCHGLSYVITIWYCYGIESLVQNPYFSYCSKNLKLTFFFKKHTNVLIFDSTIYLLHYISFFH